MTSHESICQILKDINHGTHVLLNFERILMEGGNIARDDLLTDTEGTHQSTIDDISNLMLSLNSICQPSPDLARSLWDIWQDFQTYTNCLRNATPHPYVVSALQDCRMFLQIIPMFRPNIRALATVIGLRRFVEAVSPEVIPLEDLHLHSYYVSTQHNNPHNQSQDENIDPAILDPTRDDVYRDEIEHDSECDDDGDSKGYNKCDNKRDGERLHELMETLPGSDSVTVKGLIFEYQKRYKKLIHARQCHRLLADYLCVDNQMHKEKGTGAKLFFHIPVICSSISPNLPPKLLVHYMLQHTIADADTLTNFLEKFRVADRGYEVLNCLRALPCCERVSETESAYRHVPEKCRETPWLPPKKLEASMEKIKRQGFRPRLWTEERVVTMLQLNLSNNSAAHVVQGLNKKYTGLSFKVEQIENKLKHLRKQFNSGEVMSDAIKQLLEQLMNPPTIHNIIVQALKALHRPTYNNIKDWVQSRIKSQKRDSFKGVIYGQKCFKRRQTRLGVTFCHDNTRCTHSNRNGRRANLSPC